MKVLVACEESQEVCKAFRAKGHEAYSCDIQEPSGGHLEWHILWDALAVLTGGTITTMDGTRHEIGKWDLLIAHPPCTYLTVSGNRWFNVERYGDAALNRLAKAWRKPDQIIQPYEYGHHARKTTCLWLKGLPKLHPTNVVGPGEIDRNGFSAGASATYAVDENGKIIPWDDPRTAKARSKTFPGIAAAMADQWG